MCLVKQLNNNNNARVAAQHTPHLRCKMCPIVGKLCLCYYHGQLTGSMTHLSKDRSIRVEYPDKDFL